MLTKTIHGDIIYKNLYHESKTLKRIKRISHFTESVCIAEITYLAFLVSPPSSDRKLSLQVAADGLHRYMQQSVHFVFTNANSGGTALLTSCSLQGFFILFLLIFHIITEKVHEKRNCKNL